MRRRMPRTLRVRALIAAAEIGPRRDAAYSGTSGTLYRRLHQKQVRGCLNGRRNESDPLSAADPRLFAILVGIFVIMLILRSVRYAFAQPRRRVSEMHP